MNNKKKTKLKKGDQVIVITGSQKGLRGQILLINYEKFTAILDTAESRLKSISGLKEKGPKKEKQIPIPIHLSNLMAWDSGLNQASRLTYKVTENKKQRCFKKSGSLLIDDIKNIND